MAQSLRRKPYLLTVTTISAAALLSVVSTSVVLAQDARGGPPAGGPDAPARDKDWKEQNRKGKPQGGGQQMQRQPGAQRPEMQKPGMQKPQMQRPGMQKPGMQDPRMQRPGMPKPGNMQPPPAQKPIQMQKPSGMPANGMPRQPAVVDPRRQPGAGGPQGMPSGKPPGRVDNRPGGGPNPNAGPSGGPNAGPKPGAGQRMGQPRPGFHNMDQMRSRRVERKEDGGRLVIQEPDKRMIVRQGNRLVIQKDEAQELRRFAPNARVTRNPAGITSTVVSRPNGVQIVTETDRNGQLVRRYRRDGRGRDTIIIDNRRRGISGRDVAIGVGVGVVGAAILNAIVDVPPPRIGLPRDKYIVDYDDASEEDVYEALMAPPVDPIDRRYTLDQVRATYYLRERMRRVDLDDINFATGSWDIDPGQYRKLDRMAEAMRRIVRRNPDEVFLIEGYTDAVGSDVDNLALSDRRAESVASILIEEFNVPFENLTTQGYGEQYLKIDTPGPERINRRVSVRRITPLLARAHDGPPPGPPPRGDRDDRFDDGPPGPPPRDYRD